MTPVLFVFLAVLGGCAPRPGPEVLRPTLATVPGAKLVKVYVATTSAREMPGANVFANGRARELNYAEFTVSIPPGHRTGQIEWPQGAPDPAVSFATIEQNVLDRAAFERQIAPFEGGAARSNAGVFVHGFNTNFQEALYRLAQMTADADLDGVPILFAWPSEATATGYIADKDAVTYSRDRLAELLAAISRKRSVQNVTVLGHSMGAWLTVEAIRQLRLVRNDRAVDRLNVVLAAPDIDVDVFRGQMDVIGPLPRPMTVLVSRDDVALRISSRIAGRRPRVGALDVDDARVQEAALKANVKIVDISSQQTSDSFNHDRFAGLAALYGRLSAQPDHPGHGLRQAGAFVLQGVGATIASPFTLVGAAIAGE